MEDVKLHPSVPGSEASSDVGIEILLEMAKKGQLDPWNVDIIAVADQYLQIVTEMKAEDLRGTGKLILYLAILLRMKSDQLAGINFLDPPQEEFFDDLDDGYDNGVRQRTLPFNTLEEALQRHTRSRERRIRRVTLDDLILELKKYEELERKRALRDKVEKADRRRSSAMDYSDFTEDDIQEMAHEEFQEDMIMALKEILDRVLLKQETVTLKELVGKCHLDKISAFLALLFLAARGEVAMRQSDFYEELYVEREQIEANEAYQANDSILEEAS